MVRIVYICIVVVISLILWSCCKVSSECSREEEREDEELG